MNTQMLLAQLDTVAIAEDAPSLADFLEMTQESAFTIRALVTALRQIEAHHVQSNIRKGRDESRSETLRIVRQVLDG